jgi:preprotein translocase subunit YajC
MDIVALLTLIFSGGVFVFHIISVWQRHQQKKMQEKQLEDKEGE